MKGFVHFTLQDKVPKKTNDRSKNASKVRSVGFDIMVTLQILCQKKHPSSFRKMGASKKYFKNYNLNAVSTNSFCSTACFLAKPVAGDALAGRLR